MFGFFKKDPENDFTFHKDRTRRLLVKAQDSFKRADNYLGGDGFGGNSIKQSSAQGAVEKAHSILSEAMYNAHKAFESGQGDNFKLMELKAVGSGIPSIRGEEMFSHPVVIKTWDKAMKQWIGEFDQFVSS